MRKTFFAIASVLLVLAAVSCKKEQENDLSNRPVRFTATTETSQNDKTQLSGYYLKWQEGDMVAVVSTSVTSKELYTPQVAGGYKANFVYAGNMANEPELDRPVKAGYPADYFSNDLSTITLPSAQNYVANSMENFPMYGETEDVSINFKNMCGVLRLRLVKPGENVTKIAITTTSYLNGTYSVSMNEAGLPVMEHVSGGTNGDTLYCAEPVSIDNATNFYIYLPAGSYNPMRIEVFNDRGLLCSIESTVAINIERNKITTIAPPADKLNFTFVSGLITVNAAGKQVRFATGNLVYNTSTSSFSIAEDQFITYNARYTTTSTPATVDLFYFSNGTSNNYGLTQRSDYTFTDWKESLGTDNNDWYTLTSAEWAYAVDNTKPERQYKWGFAKVTTDDNVEVRGIAMVPDEWTKPDGIEFKTWGSGSNLTSGGWNNPTNDAKMNHWTAAQWHVLEQLGVVFIPCYKASTNAYWTSSASTVNTWQRVLVENRLNSSSCDDAPYAVRLVQTYVPLTITVSGE